MDAAFGADLAARLVAKLVSLAAKQVIQAWNLDKNLETLRKRFETIGALLHDAHNKKIIMSTVEIWFNQLEDVANVTEALLDELEYEVTRKNVKYHGKPLRSFISSKNPLYCHKVVDRINSIRASFDEIFKRGKEIGLDAVAHLNTTVQPRVISSESPFEDKTSIVGRDKDISNLVQILCTNNERDLPVVAIVGMGGQGKTTLARMVLDSDDVIKMFTKRMWVTASVNFNSINILNQMVQSLTSKNLGLNNAQGLVKKLKKSLKGKKFLLVLDDVWNEESKEWEDLRNSLLRVGGAKGSSVIVTTRNYNINYKKKCVVYPLEKLQEDDSYELFKKIAFRDGGVSEIEPFSNLGRIIVKRCGGHPLAIKALGGILRLKKSEQEWRRIQNSEWRSQDVRSSLRLSYDNLPYSSLKRCFMVCSIIPKGSLIYKDQLIQIWMALGFLLPPLRSDSLMEDIGSEYFNILLWHSLLQDIQRDEFGNIKSCKMHDLVHDLALDLSEHHFVTVKTGLKLNHVSNATYLRLDNPVSDWNPTISKRYFENVRFLYARNYVFHDVLASVKHLTVLVLNTDGFGDKKAGELPNSLQHMKYIKYLDISCLRSKLPSYITKLYNLQTLRVWDLEELPKKFCNLINLRHLYIENHNGKRCLLNGIERLTCLQTLPHFVVSKDQKCPIGQLEGLQNLRGKLDLYGLSEVPNEQEARKAKLSEKSNIESLLLNWGTVTDERVNSEDIIEGLKPNTNLKELIINYFMGKRFASWMKEMTNLVKIILINLPKLEKWLEEDTSGFRGDHVQVFPKLEVLEIRSCPKLKRMPDSCFPSLKKLKISDSDMILEPMMNIKFSSLTDLDIKSQGGGGSSSMEELLKNTSQSLTKLKLDNFRGLTGLTVGVALEELRVWDCPDLTSIKAYPKKKKKLLRRSRTVEGTCRLKYLEIQRCPSVSELAKSVSSTIQEIDIDQIPGVSLLL